MRVTLSLIKNYIIIIIIIIIIIQCRERERETARRGSEGQRL